MKTQTGDYIVRSKRTATRGGIINVKQSVAAFQKDLRERAKAEKAIRTNPKYKSIIEMVLTDYNATLSITFLVTQAVRQLQPSALDHKRVVNELGSHIIMNDGTYLVVSKGHYGGVSLKGKS